MPLRFPRGLPRSPRIWIAQLNTWTPFLYPFLAPGVAARPLTLALLRPQRRTLSTGTEQPELKNDINSVQPQLVEDGVEVVSIQQPQHPHAEYSIAPFADMQELTLIAGSGGNGCVSFLREKFIPYGPANGGNGGSGGSIYVQAVYGETSLHKLSRECTIRAKPGRNGKGSSINGKRGDDVIIRVPVGTYPKSHHLGASAMLEITHPRKVYLDLSKPTLEPILLVPGAPGGLGNPNFVTDGRRRPKFATKGGKGAQMKIQLELKMLADIGLVGLPNAGKSSFLRAVSGRKARVGEWAFTTLAPNIGTIVLDERHILPPRLGETQKRLPRFTIADIPGLIADAHLNKGLGHGFLRHIERAKALCFVIDLSREDPVEDLKGLWREIKAYEQGFSGDEGESTVRGMMSEMSGEMHSDDRFIEPMAETYDDKPKRKQTPPTTHIRFNEEDGTFEYFEPDTGFVFSQKPREEAPRMTSKRWFVIANKADLLNTEGKFEALQRHLETEKEKRGDGEDIRLLPISALKEEGVEAAVDWMKSMLGFL
ncbi:GTP-binding protein Obg/CgtA [Choiromyces venosus 120613-1]|uniref:GTP-binding protein Obg/CgtA n=1 Tax=Choiromyces venosus 120613-1 TaxID=1336337 RepID=A0A3N4K6Q2_9PEZI|nr:GTP-binding protein Obg/CgtA [Choiromyces venosus 120613-1]